MSASVSQSNIFGSGNQLAFQVNSGSVNQIYSLTYVNPYWTVDGVAAGIDIFRRDVDTCSPVGVVATRRPPRASA